ncbi:Mtm1 protein [Martiniozyma asiatica (nom. inval.)]|nr:Mtm1 protein [Martiniozyma asiatica]
MSISDEIAGCTEEPIISTNRLNELSLSQRMMSACTGSLLTSMVVTPFDVVRIRLQQQQLLFPAQSVDKCCRKVFWEVSPEAKLCEPNACYHEGGKITGTFSGLKRIAGEEGFCTLYRGLGLTLLMAIPSNVVYFSGYEFMRDNSPLASNYPILNPLLCGSIARMLAATTVAPLELIKTRVQAVPKSDLGSIGGSTKILRMVVNNCIDQFKKKGFTSVYTGLGLTLWRDVPFSGIYWSFYEYFTNKLSSAPIFENSLFLRSFSAGSAAGVIAAIFTNPFDVGKTRLQVSFEDSKALGSLAAAEKENMFKFMWKIYKNEGASALYVGLLPRCMKIAPACAIMISTYEMSKKIFKEKSFDY